MVPSSLLHIVFLLPCHIPHSPQRQENTVGLVIEREREEGEQDCLRYYCNDNATILFEKWFHCTDLGKDLAPIVKDGYPLELVIKFPDQNVRLLGRTLLERYFASEQHKTGKPIPGTITSSPPFNVDTTTKLKDPFPLKKWLEDNREDIKANGSKVLFESRQTKVVVYGPGENSTDGDSETWLWQIDGEANLDCNGVKHSLIKSDVILIPAGTKFSCKRSQSDSFTVFVTMDPKVKG